MTTLFTSGRLKCTDTAGPSSPLVVTELVYELIVGVLTARRRAGVGLEGRGEATGSGQ